MWVCRTFRVLPTERRFQGLFAEQKIALYEASLRLEDDVTLRAAFRRKERVEKIQERTDESYVPKSIQSYIRRMYLDRGLTEEAIEKRIATQGRAAKASEIRQVSGEGAY